MILAALTKSRAITMAKAGIGKGDMNWVVKIQALDIKQYSPNEYFVVDEEGLDILLIGGNYPQSSVEWST